MSNSLHLAFFIPSLVGGGAQQVTTTLAHAFAEKGTRVDLYVTSKQDAFLDQIDSDVSIFDLGRKKTFYTLPGLIRLLRRRKPDLLVTALPNALVVGWAATTYLRILGEHCPAFCATVHTLQSVHDERSTGLQSTVLLQLARLVLRYTEHVVAVSKTLAQEISSYTGRAREEIEVIYNPIDTASILSKGEANVSHPWFRQNRPVIVGVGRLRREKNFATLLRAVAKSNVTPKVRTIILGDGPRRTALKHLSAELGIERNVEFFGFLDNPYPVMNKADVVVLPSPAEAFGNVLVEAMACGTPVVAMQGSGGPVEILDNLEPGYPALAPPKNASALARTIEQCLQTPVPSKILKNRAGDFDVSVGVKHYETLFQRMTKHRQASRTA